MSENQVFATLRGLRSFCLQPCLDSFCSHGNIIICLDVLKGIMLQKMKGFMKQFNLLVFIYTLVTLCFPCGTKSKARCPQRILPCLCDQIRLKPYQAIPCRAMMSHLEQLPILILCTTLYFSSEKIKMLALVVFVKSTSGYLLTCMDRLKISCFSSVLNQTNFRLGSHALSCVP